MQTSNKALAVELRQEGYSYNFISEKTGVSKSTLHYWLASIPYIPNEVSLRRISDGRSKAKKVKNERKLLTFTQAEAFAKSKLIDLTDREWLLLGLGLYIGEGQKNETVGIINSDPRVINFSIMWLDRVFGIKSKNLTLAIHLYPDNNIKDCLRFWSETTGIPIEQFGKAQIDKRSGKNGLKRGKLPYGTAHLRVKSLGNKEFGVRLSRRIHALMNEVLKLRA